MVKSYNHLFEKVISDYNLSLAIDNATAEKDEKSGAKDRAEHINRFLCVECMSILAALFRDVVRIMGRRQLKNLFIDTLLIASMF